ncbi:MAG: hypothetical protein ACJA13_001879 [Paraglaciecola sp.]|jgi:hypothetical protein
MSAIFPVLQRSRSIRRTNLALLDQWVQNEPLIRYIKPKTAIVALLKYDLGMKYRDFLALT